ncbi:MAG: glycosyltransferase [Prolixibacteraceae bacterium]|nr:glycosyltransferase [Prolixibacteraceae bacterium]
MKVILFSTGTRGDIEPFLAIAQLLKERDCDVICIFPEQYREIVESMELSFKGFSKDILNLINGREMKMIFGNQGSLLKRIRILIKMARVSLKLSKDSLDLQHRIQMEEKPDRILYHPKCNYSVVWGMGNPGKTILINPTLDPLTDMGGNHGIFLNKINRWFVNTMKAVMLKQVSKRYKNDFSGIKITVPLIKRAMLEKEKTFYTISPSLFPKPTNWSPNVNIVGYYERDTTIDWQPDEKLMQFIDKNEKIIFITFGSMSNPNPREKTRSIVEVLKRNNIPAIINISWGGLEKIDEVPNSIFFTSDLPYSWIFSKVYAVVHHGGSGTTHTALKYACPSLIIPHILDQFFWEKTISKLQLGPKGISIRKFNEKEFEIRLLDMYYNKNYKKNALMICEKMQSESDKNKLYEMIMN